MSQDESPAVEDLLSRCEACCEVMINLIENFIGANALFNQKISLVENPVNFKTKLDKII